MASSTATHTRATSPSTSIAGALTYIDLGLVGRLDQTKRLDLLDLLFSFQENDAVGLASVRAARLEEDAPGLNVHRVSRRHEQRC